MFREVEEGRHITTIWQTLIALLTKLVKERVSARLQGSYTRTRCVFQKLRYQINRFGWRTNTENLQFKYKYHTITIVMQIEMKIYIFNDGARQQ